MQAQRDAIKRNAGDHEMVAWHEDIASGKKLECPRDGLRTACREAAVRLGLNASSPRWCDWRVGVG